MRPQAMRLLSTSQDKSAAKPDTTKKIETALEIRKSSSKAREGKPLAFPTHRMAG